MSRINLPESIEAAPTWVGNYIELESGETYIITAASYKWIEWREMTLTERLEYWFVRLKWWQILLVILASMVVGGVLTVSFIVWYTSLIP